jgi:hypothetical protein
MSYIPHIWHAGFAIRLCIQFWRYCMYVKRRPHLTFSYMRNAMHLPMYCSKSQSICSHGRNDLCPTMNIPRTMADASFSGENNGRRKARKQQRRMVWQLHFGGFCLLNCWGSRTWFNNANLVLSGNNCLHRKIPPFSGHTIASFWWREWRVWITGAKLVIPLSNKMWRAYRWLL